VNSFVLGKEIGLSKQCTGKCVQIKTTEKWLNTCRTGSKNQENQTGSKNGSWFLQLRQTIVSVLSQTPHAVSVQENYLHCPLWLHAASAFAN